MVVFFNKLGIKADKFESTSFGFQPATEAQAIIMDEICHNFDIEIPEGVDFACFSRAIVEEAMEVAMDRSLVQDKYPDLTIEGLDKIRAKENEFNQPVDHTILRKNEKRKNYLNTISALIKMPELAYQEPQLNIDTLNATTAKRNFLIQAFKIDNDIVKNLRFKEAGQLITELCHREAAGLADLQPLLDLNEHKAPDMTQDMSKWTKAKATSIEKILTFIKMFTNASINLRINMRK